MPELPIESFEIFARGLDHPEGLAFDRDGFLWAGGEAGQVYRIAPDGHVETVAQLGVFCAGLAFSPAGELFVCAVGLGVVRVCRTGRWEVFAANAGGGRLVCPNFPLFAADGTLWVTDSGEWKKRNGRLVRFAPDGTGEVLVEPLGYANGLASDGARIYLVESDGNRIYRFALLPDARLGPAELHAGGVGRFPDGLAVDSGGDLYVACYASDDIHRIGADGTRTLVAFDPEAILLSRPTNLAFGGHGRDEIYVANLGRTTITRARLGRPGRPLANQGDS